ncbi:hypothetical protein LCGC14_1493350 [marine sediment metagenome]|uniref:Uncharacterized protein n=1 Tax=marine sediment metagenome TaxID=412755 RepID=A0A0F9JS04_9ZZZZ
MTGEAPAAGCGVVGCLTLLVVILALLCVMKFLWTYLVS